MDYRPEINLINDTAFLALTNVNRPLSIFLILILIP